MAIANQHFPGGTLAVNATVEDAERLTEKGLNPAFALLECVFCEHKRQVDSRRRADKSSGCIDSSDLAALAEDSRERYALQVVKLSLRAVDKLVDGAGNNRPKALPDVGWLGAELFLSRWQLCAFQGT